MKNPRLFSKRTLQSFEGVSQAPSNYYTGRRRWPLVLPDNVLLFSRRERDSLRVQHPSSHFHHRWVLLIVLETEGVVGVSGRLHTLQAGAALLIPPLHFHYYQSISADTLAWLYITFDWPEQVAPDDESLKTGRLSEEGARCVGELLECWHAKDPAAGTRLSVRVLELLLLTFPALLKRSRPTRPQGKRRHALVMAVREAVAARSGRALSISELARELGMSESHLRAEFRLRSGVSLGRFLREWRLREAALLLSSENLSVKETAERMGFADIYAFSRSFSKTLGVSPSRLRRAR